jgi:hypothetical protein
VLSVLLLFDMLALCCLPFFYLVWSFGIVLSALLLFDPGPKNCRKDQAMVDITRHKATGLNSGALVVVYVAAAVGLFSKINLAVLQFGTHKYYREFYSGGFKYSGNVSPSYMHIMMSIG